MSVKVAMILAGCGAKDGSEIRETIFTLLALDECNIVPTVFAPNRLQKESVNHLTGEVLLENRIMLDEAARLTRGVISPLENINVDEFDALIMPGGFGLAKNLSSFQEFGVKGTVDSKLQEVIIKFFEAKKVIGAICIAPTLLGMALAHKNILVTCGNDDELESELATINVKTQKVAVNDISIDVEHKIICTPAYMDSNAHLSQIRLGIKKLVEKVVELSSN